MGISSGGVFLCDGMGLIVLGQRRFYFVRALRQTCCTQLIFPMILLTYHHCYIVLLPDLREAPTAAK